MMLQLCRLYTFSQAKMCTNFPSKERSCLSIYHWTYLYVLLGKQETYIKQSCMHFWLIKLLWLFSNLFWWFSGVEWLGKVYILVIILQKLHMRKWCDINCTAWNTTIFLHVHGYHDRSPLVFSGVVFLDY